jgi:hypothetical protein
MIINWRLSLNVSWVAGDRADRRGTLQYAGRSG